MKTITHTSVLVDEVLHLLKITSGRTYVDGTLGSGGHTLEFLKRGAHVIAIDQDGEAIKRSEARFTEALPDSTPDVQMIRDNIANIDVVLDRLNVRAVHGVLFDLGVSSEQLDDPKRGFSFNKDAPLDMRMDDRLSVTAADLINALNEQEMIELFVTYGEVYKPQRLANHIIKARNRRPIKTTVQLADIIRDAYGKMWHRPIHPATQVFQALRIAVNDEMNSVAKAIGRVTDYLVVGGRIAVISFHSIEDRMIKVEFKRNEQLFPITEKPITPSDEEIKRNPRARSAKLRVAEKLRDIRKG